MRILHTSDTHGLPLDSIPLDGIDVIVHSGDFLPTKGRNVMIGERIKPRREMHHQWNWVGKMRDGLAAWAGKIPFLLTNGNHCYIDAVPALCDVGMNAIRIDSMVNKKATVIDGVSFFGFAPVRYEDGEWNKEFHEHEIAAHAIDFPDVDVLVTHSPPANVLDYGHGRHWGSTALANEYVYSRERSRRPKLWLFGHTHGAAGKMYLPGTNILCVNSATIYQTIQIGV